MALIFAYQRLGYWGGGGGGEVKLNLCVANVHDLVS